MSIQLRAPVFTRQTFLRLTLVCASLMSGVFGEPAVGQGTMGTYRLPVMLNGFNSLLSLANIEIPNGAKISCSPFGRVGSNERRLTLSGGGTYFNDVVILTGRPADIHNIAREVLGVPEPLDEHSLDYLGQYARGADSPEKIQELLRYSQQSVSLYSSGLLPGGQQRPALDAIKLVLLKSLELYTRGDIPTPVFADLNYVTGFPAIQGNPWGIEGSPWGIEGSPWGIEGSPWGIEGSPVKGTNAEKLAQTQTIAEGAFWRQWAFQNRGVGLYDNTFQRSLPPSADGSGSRVVLFDTAPYSTAGLHNETRQRLSMNLCVHLVPLPTLEATPDKTGYLRDHGLFGAGLTFAAAPQSELHLVRVLDDNAVGDLYSLTAGIEAYNQFMLPENGGTLRDVVYNFSLGLKPLGDEIPTDIQALLQEIVHAMPDEEQPELINGLPLLSLEIPLAIAYDMGAVLIASAGNDSAGLPTPVAQNAPAAYSFVLGVQSTNMSQQRSCYSNTGEVGAPGGDGGVLPACEPQLGLCNVSAQCDFGVVSLVSNRSDTVGFAYWVGSSFAAPLVSGVAADALENGVPYDKVSLHLEDSAIRTGVVDAESATKP